MRFENWEVWGFEHAVRAARNPLDSWDKSDSGKGCLRLINCNKVYTQCDNCNKAWDGCLGTREFILGEKDLDLFQRLIKAGSSHRKMLRQIFISTDIIAPVYYMAEFDTYKIGVTRNSCSFQHKGTAEPYVKDRFMIDDEFKDDPIWDDVIKKMNEIRDLYLETKDYKYFRWLRQLCPQGYLYRSTVTMSYENVYNMYHQRKNHALSEWSEDFVRWVEMLPYAEELIIGVEEKD